MPTILIVDDEPAMRRMLDLIFRQEGFNVFAAANGLEALRHPLLQSGQIDIVITDVSMPEMDGIALAENLRGQQPHLPIVILSACSEYLDAGSCNAAVIMSKPFDIQALLNAVRSLLSKRVSPAVV